MPDSNEQLLVAFARLEGKVDLTLAEITALKGTDADHEHRLRSIEAQPRPDPDTEARIRSLEDRHTISPAQLWAGLVGVVTVIAGAAATINAVSGLIG